MNKLDSKIGMEDIELDSAPTYGNYLSIVFLSNYILSIFLSINLANTYLSVQIGLKDWYGGYRVGFCSYPLGTI